MKPQVSIYNWSVITNPNSYQAPEAITVYLAGDALDHPDGPGFNTNVRTSRIVRLDLKGRQVETANTLYTLEGPPDAEWVAFLRSIDYDLTQLPD